jgi:hypothetical protein
VSGGQLLDNSPKKADRLASPSNAVKGRKIERAARLRASVNVLRNPDIAIDRAGGTNLPDFRDVRPRQLCHSA